MLDRQFIALVLTRREGVLESILVEWISVTRTLAGGKKALLILTNAAMASGNLSPSNTVSRFREWLVT